ncbi:MAG TPA: hypothetical protein VK760_11200 [Candidatus Acidoferrales bacterium]|jgi:hypothetical protein|nr:hypothetical protein [Candidatus Acidoferrales bacterium]
MKRNLFIASVATVISAVCWPSLAKAEAQAQGWPKPSWCCDSAVVWLDSQSGAYYRPGASQYGRTERGAYACEKHAIESGNRAR